jgi:hypothetical protein
VIPVLDVAFLVVDVFCGCSQCFFGDAFQWIFSLYLQLINRLVTIWRHNTLALSMNNLRFQNIDCVIMNTTVHENINLWFTCTPNWRVHCPRLAREANK